MFHKIHPLLDAAPNKMLIMTIGYKIDIEMTPSFNMIFYNHTRSVTGCSKARGLRSKSA